MPTLGLAARRQTSISDIFRISAPRLDFDDLIIRSGLLTSGCDLPRRARRVVVACLPWFAFALFSYIIGRGRWW